MKLLLIAIYLVFYFLVGIFINIEIRTLQKKTRLRHIMSATGLYAMPLTGFYNLPACGAL